MSRFEPFAMLQELRGWVEIESPTAAPERVSRLVRHVRGALDAAGLVTELVPGRDGRGDHLRARTPWGGDGAPGILVLAHLDTVHPLGTLERHLPFRIDGDRAYGPGIYDMKGGAFLAMAAIRPLLAAGGTTPLPIRWLYTADEEVGSPTSRALIEEEGRRARYVLVVEPARDGGKCVTARKGTARYVLRCHGRAAHSGARHQDGRSAVRELAHHILELEALTDYARGVTVNVGHIVGGTTFNTVPDQAEAWIDVRLPDPASAAALLPVIERRVAREPEVRIEIAGGLNRPPYPRTPPTMALLARAQALAGEIGFALEDTASGGGSDGNFLADRLPVLDGLGVDGAGAHTHDEHILISSLVPRAELLARLYATLD
jgi:glutamate carboxypeptidase